jgi:L-asparaginase
MVTTFLSPDQGFVTQFIAGQPYYFSSPSLPKARHYFNLFGIGYPLPPVVVLYGHRE